MLRLGALDDQTSANEIEGREEDCRDDVGENGAEEEGNWSRGVNEREGREGEIGGGRGEDDNGESRK